MPTPKQLATNVATTLFGQSPATFRAELGVAINTLNELAALHDKATADTTVTTVQTQTFTDQRDALVVTRFQAWLAANP
ncbi:MAG: hypothetical protein JNM17_04115 [Archangium sp.]|nr:hypothetical protein [Archangium sp.]